MCFSCPSLDAPPFSVFFQFVEGPARCLLTSLRQGPFELILTALSPVHRSRFFIWGPAIFFFLLFSLDSTGFQCLPQCTTSFPCQTVAKIPVVLLHLVNAVCRVELLFLCFQNPPPSFLLSVFLNFLTRVLSSVGSCCLM